jgi:tRNA1(Val) A37 N6-methylase TrmN6
METKVETLPGGTLVFTSKAHAITTDSLLLLDFCPCRPGFSVCDLGSGCGILLLGLVDKGLQGPATGVEQSAEGVALLQRAIDENGLGQTTAVKADITAFSTARPFDLVVANPPYFTQGARSPVLARAAARHQLRCSIGDVAAAAFRLLKDGGRLALCWPAGQIQSLFAALQANRLAAKTLQWVRKTPGSSPWLVLAEARKAGGEGVVILPDRLLPPGQTTRY